MRVSSGTHPKIPRTTHAFLQERAQYIRETLARFFRNAPKKSMIHLRVSSGTPPQKSEGHWHVSSGTRPKNSANHSHVSSGTRPKIPRSICAFLQERAQKFRDPFVRFFRNAPKKSTRHSRVSCVDRLKNSAKHVRVYSNDTSKSSSRLERNIFKKNIFLKKIQVSRLFDTFKGILLAKTTQTTLFFSRVLESTVELCYKFIVPEIETIGS